MVTEGIETHYIDVERVIKERVFCQNRLFSSTTSAKLMRRNLLINCVIFGSIPLLRRTQ